MEAILNDVEVRVLGALIEKQITTPDYYPLTLNALVNACNQISNRDPVVSYDERTVAEALESLRAKNLVYVFYGSESRVPKYKHMAVEIFKIAPPELALMCVLMLRGPQTVGELRGRTGRMHEFASLAEVETTLDALASRDDEPLVVKLPRQHGRKESRYAHLLSGAPDAGEDEAAASTSAASSEQRASSGERISRLETEVESLRNDLSELRRQFDDFRRQFE